MRVIKSVGLIVLGVVLGIAGSTASARVDAQAPRFIQPGQQIQPGQPVGTIITGENTASNSSRHPRVGAMSRPAS
jgi:hypothetical protein